MYVKLFVRVVYVCNCMHVYVYVLMHICMGLLFMHCMWINVYACRYRQVNVHIFWDISEKVCLFICGCIMILCIYVFFKLLCVYVLVHICMVLYCVHCICMNECECRLLQHNERMCMFMQEKVGIYMYIQVYKR